MQTTRRRFRTMTHPSKVDYFCTAGFIWWRGWFVPPPPYESGSNFPMGWTGIVSEIKDCPRTPNWREILQKEYTVTLNDVELDKHERRIIKPGFVSVDCPIGPFYRYSGDFGPVLSELAQPPVLAISDSDYEFHTSLALMKAYAKMNAPQIVGGEYVKEFSKTVNMLRRPFSSSFKLLGKIAKTRGKILKKKAVTVRNFAEANANAWLEHRYGWKPIVMDANHVLESIIARNNIHGSVRVARGSSKESNSVPFGFSGKHPVRDFSLEFDGTVASELRASAGVLYRINPRNRFNRGLEYFGFRTRDIPATLWELTPYSFVVDWFTNIGLFLQAITPNPDVEILGNWITTVETSTLTFNDGTLTSWSNLGGYNEGTGNTGSYVETRTKYSRACNQPLTFTALVPRVNMGPIQAISGLSLTTQQLIKQLRNFKH